jgi:site-specific DNA recombinase
VIVLFRDRLARGVYAQILIEEFAQHGTRLIALNTQNVDDSPEGELQGGILDVISGWERKKITERTRRGKLEKARKGNAIATRTPPYGFRFSADRKTYEVNEATMPTVWRIFELVAGGASVTSVPRILAGEGYPPPRR